jgi:flagellar hook protein FlgE
MSSFSIALSGLSAASTDLQVTANNIANADTIGFKSSVAEFADVYASGGASLNTAVIGEGVRLAQTAQQFVQGNINTTSSNLDLAISGNGFFTLQDANGISYTRNGQFSLDSNGNVVSSTGAALQVYPPLSQGGFNTGALSDLNLQTAQSQPLATTGGTVSVNLPAGSTTVYDSLGNSYPATFYFSQTATPSVWAVNMTVNGTQVGAAQDLTFNSSGAVTVPAGGALSFAGFTPPDGASAMTMGFNFGSTTQFGGSFGVNNIAQNGYSTGQLSTVAINSQGIVSAVYTNGRSTQLGQLAMANFSNPQGLEQLGNTSWAQTFSSGNAVMGTAASAGFGNVQSGALESSNVDLTTELVNMITAQRSFDANAQVVTTADQESQTVISTIQNG